MSRLIRIGLVWLLGAMLLPVASRADVITWNFSDDNGDFDTGTPLNLSVSAFSVGNVNGALPANDPITSTSASSGYGGASGTFNIGNAARVGSLNTQTSAYYEVTFASSAGYTLAITDFDFAARSMSNGGPMTFALRSSLDGYSSNAFTATLSSNNTWAVRNNTFNAPITSGDAITLRLFAYNGVGSAVPGTINSRLDDIAITADAIPLAAEAAVPLPGAILAGPLLFGLVGIVRRGRRRRRSVA